MSISQICVLYPLLACICAISSRVSICSVQLRPFLNPACSSDSLLCTSRCLEISWLSNLSSIFAHRFISDMGLWFDGSSSPCRPLGSRQIWAWFIAVGIWVVFHICSRRRIDISSAGWPPCYIISAVIPSGPGAFPLGICFINYLILSLVGGLPSVSLLCSSSTCVP